MAQSNAKFLIIQTAFIGDVVLALPVAQALRQKYPDAEIHFLVRKGNESLLLNHPAANKVWVWDKKNGKLQNLLRLIRGLRKIRFEKVINLHRFTSSGLITLKMKSKEKVGFDKNPMSIFYAKRIKHDIPKKPTVNYRHEVERNLSLIDEQYSPQLRPQLYPSSTDFEKVKAIVQGGPYFVIAPASVWFTKQYPAVKWKELINVLPKEFDVYLIGAKGDFALGESIRDSDSRIKNLSGQLSFLESAALIKNASRTFTNDSAPLHFASAMNAPVTAVFCSTIPAFGFGPLSDDSKIAQIEGDLYCRPCGLHGFNKCPEGHFRCALEISANRVFSKMDEARVLSQIHSEDELIALTAQTILDGGIAIHQTDTIPGFAADATNDEAAKKVFTAKGRSEEKTFIVLCSDMDMVKQFVDSVPGIAREILETAKDIPVTLIYPGAKNLAASLGRDDKTIAIRIPKHEQTIKLIKAVGKPLVSSSVNLSGEKAAIALNEIGYGLATKADFILYSDKPSLNQSSTIISIAGEEPKMIRKGLMNPELRKILKLH